jgi:hypothetical protein
MLEQGTKSETQKAGAGSGKGDSVKAIAADVAAAK